MNALDHGRFFFESENYCYHKDYRKSKYLKAEESYSK